MLGQKDFYIANNQDLEMVEKLILEAKTVSIDTEFTREKTYYPILSLIQVAVFQSHSSKGEGEKRLFIIDCLADIDLSSFFQIVADQKITKILHSSLQDLQIFYQKSNLLPAGIADTQILANFCGFGFNVGYSKLVEAMFEEQIDKSQQRSDWQQRPLSEKQMEYALSDVIYLEEIHEILLKILEEKNRQNWYYEEVKNFADNAVIQINENLFKRFSFKGKTDKQISQIKKLIIWREKWAQKLDKPRQHFLKDEAIEKIVVFGDLGFKFDKNMLGQVKEILNQDFEVSEDSPNEKRSFFMSAQQKDLYKTAKEFIAKIAQEEDFKEQFLITSDSLKSIICGYKTAEESLSSWRYELFGEGLKKLISN